LAGTSGWVTLQPVAGNCSAEARRLVRRGKIAATGCNPIAPVAGGKKSRNSAAVEGHGACCTELRPPAGVHELQIGPDGGALKTMLFSIARGP
jgi:hypothetical protein